MIVEKKSIYKKVKEQFSLTNKYFYWSLFILLTTVLTGINNYYFYKNIKSSTEKNNQQLENIIKDYEKINKNTTSEDFRKNIVLISQAFINKASYNNSLIILEENNKQPIWKKPQGKDYPKVIDSNIEIVLSSNQNTIKEYTANVNFDELNLYHTIIKSMTFSIVDIFDKINNNETTILDLKQFIEKIVIPRSSPAFWYAILIYLILFLSKRRTYKLEELKYKEDQIIKTKVKEETATKTESETQILTQEIQNKMIRYDSILNPPINYLTINDVFDNDLDSIGTKFRKVAEKIIFQVYQLQIGALPYRLSLSSAIYELNQRRILSDTAKNYISIVRVYGNISSHYSDSVICKEEAIAIASSLLNVIDEIYEKNLLGNSKLI